ncbi:MAG: aspartate dehydrogenase [Ruminococcaceae bacterium]|nr:aspartate dehydrogenase [Oscillospiraceae bacterium]
MFGRKTPVYSLEEFEPVIRASICTGEKVAGFRNRHSGVFEDQMLIRTPADIEEFRKKYSIPADMNIPTIY